MQILLASSQILLQSTTARHTQWQGAKVLVYLEQDRISKFKRFKFQFEKLRQALLSICILCSFWDSSLFARMTFWYTLFYEPLKDEARHWRLCFTQAAMPRSPHESRFMSKPKLAAVKPSAARWCSLRFEDDPFQLRPPVVHRCSNFKSLLPHQIVSKEPESLLNSNTTSTLQWIHRPKDISLFRFQQQLLLVVVHYTVSSIYYSVQYTLVH